MQIPDNILVTTVMQGIIDKMNSKYAMTANYFVGTPLETNNIRQKDVVTATAKLKYPFIALFEPIDFKIEPNKNSPIHGVASIWMVFMTENNHTAWTDAEIRTNAINPMAELVQKFLVAMEIKNGNTIGEHSNMTSTVHNKWGLVAKMQGHTANVFAEHLAGIELNFNLEILKNYTC